VRLVMVHAFDGQASGDVNSALGDRVATRPGPCHAAQSARRYQRLVGKLPRTERHPARPSQALLLAHGETESDSQSAVAAFRLGTGNSSPQ
jgi:hypothetical protein